MQLPNTLNKPLFIQKLQWLIDPVSYMESAAKLHPDIFAAGVATSRESDCIVYINHPQAIQEILTNDRKKFAAPADVNKILEPLFGSQSLVMIDGESHKRRRQLLVPPFHGERMLAYGQIICDIAEAVFQQIPKNKPFAARPVLQEISLQVILQVVFGLRSGERYEKIQQLLGLMLDVFKSPISSSPLLFPILQKDLGAWSPWGNFLRQRQQIDDLLYAEIAERREKQDIERVDILSLMMSARDEDGNPMSDKELRDELMTLLFAGHETTATAMAWGLYWSNHLPQVKDKLLAEIDSLGNSPDPMSISRLPYLGAFCHETLRICPVAMLTFVRVVKEPVELLGYQLKPGNYVAGCMYLLHQREDLYPQPKEFKPERFLERQYSPYEFMPFGGGARRCVGDALAVFEMKVVIAKILSCYEMVLADTKPEKPQRRGITLAPANGVKMVITGERVPSTSLLATVK